MYSISSGISRVLTATRTAPERRNAVVRLEQLRRVQCQVGDAVAALDPGLLECDGQPAGPLAELRPGQPALPVDDGESVGEHRARALEEGDRRQRGEVYLSVHAVP